MDEKDFFNRDSMFWREVNATSPDMMAEIELNASLEIDGVHVNSIACLLLPFESADVVHEIADGGAFKKNEVQAWPYVNLNDLAFYKDNSNTEDARKEKICRVDHANIQSITLKDAKGNVVLTKTKI
ncbi:MAG: hypothetical protein GQ574_23915 [Crocinitomix sp.]|nr:hypothetical protein [Crocinitomix sp.]